MGTCLPPNSPCSSSTPTYSHTFENVVAGTYTFSLTAINSNDPALTAVAGTTATTSGVIVGLPGQLRLQSAAGAVGKASISWLPPVFDPSALAGA